MRGIRSEANARGGCSFGRLPNRRFTRVIDLFGDEDVAALLDDAARGTPRRKEGGW
jgi:hypothetical protein